MKFIPIYNKDNIKVEVDVDRAPIIFRFKIDNRLYKISYRDYIPVGKSYKNHNMLVNWLKLSNNEILNIISHASYDKNRIHLINNKLNV